MIFVYYADEHYEMGGVGLEQLRTQAQAAEFIAARMKSHPQATFENYTVIEGERLQPKAVEVITKVAFD